MFLLVVVQLVEGAMTEPVRGDMTLWPLAYVHVAIGLVIALALYWRADHPAAFRRRRPNAPAAEGAA